MTKTTTKRELAELVRIAKRQGHRGEAAEKLAQRVAESLAARRTPKTPPEWVGCR